MKSLNAELLKTFILQNSAVVKLKNGISHNRLDIEFDMLGWKLYT